MKFNHWATLLCVLITVGASTQAFGAKDVKVENLPGYVDLAKIEIPAGAEEVMDIDLGPSLLKLAAKSDAGKNEKLSEALSQIESIRVKSFSIGKEQSANVQRHIEEIEKKLAADDWHRVIHVKDGNEVISVSTKQQDDMIIGLMIMVFEPGAEAHFVNVVGHIDLASIMGMAVGMEGIDFEDLVEELKSGEDR